MEQKAFDLIVGRLEAAMTGQGFKKATGGLQEPEGKAALFLGDGAAYSVLYEEKRKRFSLRICDLEEDKPNGKWKTLSMWLYDPETDTPAQVQSIVDDFTETVSGPKQAAAITARKKRKKDDENNVDPTFFFNRFIGIFPELRDELNEEKARYGDVRTVTFTRERLLPKINALLSSSAEKGRADRCAGLLNDQYVAGNLDVRALITIVILNGMEERAVETLRPLMNEELTKSFKSGLKLKGKKIKPEKKKKKAKKFMADTLLNR